MVLGLGAAPELDAKPVTVADLLAGAPAADWRVPNLDDTLYLELPRGRVVIELATRAAPQHAANIKLLARAHYFDGLAIIRVQDNYVVQWDDESHHRPLPAGVRPAVEFTADAHAEPRCASSRCRTTICMRRRSDSWTDFPAGSAIRARTPCGWRIATAWSARAATIRRRATGAELYAVIGNAPRQLDRNVALVGRVLKGMELLSTLPRGSGEMGFYVASEPRAHHFDEGRLGCA
jgi:peptidylprolyl isomerase